MRKPRSMPEFSDIHSVTLDQEAKLALSAASAKWPDLADSSVQQLILEVIRDWEQWANVERGKEALVLYECEKTTHLLELLADFVGRSPDMDRILPYRDWCEEYKSGKGEFHIMPSEAPLKPRDIGAKYTVRITPDHIRALRFAFGQPRCTANSVSALVRWVIIDWAKWDLAYGGKTMLKLYEQYKIRHIVEFMAEHIPFNPQNTMDEFTFDEWAADYRQRRDDYLYYREPVEEATD